MIEKNPKSGDFGEAEADNLIPRADVVAITGTALTNHTLDISSKGLSLDLRYGVLGKLTGVETSGRNHIRGFIPVVINMFRLPDLLTSDMVECNGLKLL
jgi:hypothetical protein